MRVCFAQTPPKLRSNSAQTPPELRSNSAQTPLELFTNSPLLTREEATQPYERQRLAGFNHALGVIEHRHRGIAAQ